MLDKMWLYAVGAVLVLGLLMPFDKVSADCRTNSDGSVTCGSNTQIGDGTFANDQNPNNSGSGNNNNNNNNNNNHTWNNNNNGNNSGSDKPRWNICINGVSLVDGKQCDDDTGFGWNKPRKLTATGAQALDVLTNMNPILGSGYDQKGFFRQIGVYNGRYQLAQGRVFRCTVSPEAYKYTCQSLN